jgi:hypothetical protein
MENETLLEPFQIGAFGAFTLSILVYFHGAQMTRMLPVLQKPPANGRSWEIAHLASPGIVCKPPVVQIFFVLLHPIFWAQT